MAYSSGRVDTVAACNHHMCKCSVSVINKPAIKKEDRKVSYHWTGKDMVLLDRERYGHCGEGCPIAVQLLPRSAGGKVNLSRCGVLWWVQEGSCAYEGDVRFKGALHLPGFKAGVSNSLLSPCYLTLACGDLFLSGCLRDK